MVSKRQKDYEKSARGKEIRQTYEQSKKGKEKAKKANSSPSGIKARKKYYKSEKGRMNISRKNEKRAGKKHAKILGIMIKNCELHHLTENTITCVPTFVHSHCYHTGPTLKIEGVIG